MVSSDESDSSPSPGAAGDGRPAPPYWWEDPDLAAAVAEVEEFVGAGGWDAAPTMFALVRTAELLAAQPALAGTLDDAGVFTPIAQDPLPAGDLSEALSHISWPAEVAGCVLVQEIVVLPPSAVGAPAGGPGVDPATRTEGRPDHDPDGQNDRRGSGRVGQDVEITAEQAAAHPDRAEARLAAGVLRDLTGGACLLRVRGRDDATPLRGADLAPNLLVALQATFD